MCYVLFELYDPNRIFTVFFFNDTATTEIYTLSLHDALPICAGIPRRENSQRRCRVAPAKSGGSVEDAARSEEHTSELQSPCNLVCRLLLEKKKQDMIGSQLVLFSRTVLVMLHSRPAQRVTAR